MKYPSMLFLALLIPLHTLRLQTALPISPHETQEILATEVRRFDSDKTRMPEQLAELARAYHIPMGIEAIYRPDEQLTPLHSKGGTVKDAIDLIVRQAPGYSWQVTNDVLHVYPTGLMNDPKNFLNIRISRFELTKTSLLVASAELRLKIKMTLHPERYTQGYGGGYGWGTTQPRGFDTPNITLDVRDLTVREILDRLILLNGNALWVVYLFQDVLMDDEDFYLPTDYLFPGRKIELGFFWSLIPLG